MPKREIGSASGTASKVTAGSPYVLPSILETAPPSEWPVIQTFDIG